MTLTARLARLLLVAVAWPLAALAQVVDSLPPGYRKRAIWHIVSPKQPETREWRLAALIDACARGVRLR